MSKPLLHGYINFATSVCETVKQSLRHSCRSLLMRQGISLILSQSFDQVWTFSLSSLHIIHHYVVHYMHNKDSTLDTQRKVSEDPKDFAFLRIIQSLAFYCIQVSRFPHISQRSWFPADCPISCILLYTSIKVPAYMLKILVCIVQSVSRALRSFPHIVGLHSFLTKKGGSIYLRTVKVTAAV